MPEYIEREAKVVPKKFYVVRNKDGFLWCGYNRFTRRPWQAKFYSDIRQAQATAKRCVNDGAEVVGARIIFDFEDAPAVDVAPVVHGRYIPDQRYQGVGNCGMCGGIVTMLNNYCPNCGARMDGE